MKIKRAILSCTVVVSLLSCNSVLSDVLSLQPCDEPYDHMVETCPDLAHFYNTSSHAHTGLRSIEKGLNPAVLNYSAPGGFGAVTSQLLTRVGKAEDPGSSMVFSEKSPNEHNVPAVNSKKHLNNKEVLDSMERRGGDKLGDPQNLPAPLVAAIIALIGVVAVARRKIT